MIRLIPIHDHLILSLKIGKMQKCWLIETPQWRVMKRSAKLRAKLLIDKLTRRTVYYYCSGHDCDHSHFGYQVKYKNIYEAEIEIDDMYEWADGPMNFSRISKKEYREAESYKIDKGAERANY
jgi:hypothetical protein